MRRNRKQFYEERGWQHKGNALCGWYRTRYKAFKGRIEKPFAKKPQYLITKPPEELLGGPHGACFTEVSEDVFAIHWNKRPDNVNTGIMRMEHYLHEALA